MVDATSKYQLYKNGITIDSDIDEGVVVVEVSKNTPADVAGLKKGDVILELNGTKITNIAYFRAELYKYNVGDTIKLKIMRDNNIKEVKVKLDVTLENS